MNCFFGWGKVTYLQLLMDVRALPYGTVWVNEPSPFVFFLEWRILKFSSCAEMCFSWFPFSARALRAVHVKLDDENLWSSTKPSWSVFSCGRKGIRVLDNFSNYAAHLKHLHALKLWTEHAFPERMGHLQTKIIRKRTERLESFPDLDTLPPEVAVAVLSHLNPTDLCLAACVWDHLANNDLLWQR